MCRAADPRGSAVAPAAAPPAMPTRRPRRRLGARTGRHRRSPPERRWPTARAWVVDEVGAERAPDVLVRGSQVAQAAAVAGIVASVALAGVGLNVPIVVAAAAWLGLGVTLIVVMPERGFTPAPPQERGSWRSMRGQALTAVRATRANPALMFLLAALLRTAFASEGLDRLTQLHFLDDVGFPSTSTPVIWFGVLSVVGMFCAIGFTELIRRSVDLTDPARVAGQLVGGPPLGLTAERLSIRAALLGAASIIAPAVPFLIGAVRRVPIPLRRPPVDRWDASGP
jgi:hypothetical protein